MVSVGVYQASFTLKIIKDYELKFNEYPGVLINAGIGFEYMVYYWR